jgi:hypothetical protein
MRPPKGGRILGIKYGGLAERLMRRFRKPVGAIPCRFESCALR